MRMIAGVTSVVLAVSVMSAGCATERRIASGDREQAASGRADAVMYINGLSCPL